MTALEGALGLRARGFALLPVSRGSKRPNVAVLNSVYGDPAWGRLGREPASEPEIRAWFDCDAETNIGIVTGAISNVVVLDVDRPTPALRHPPTPTVATGRGRHLYFALTTPTKSRRVACGDIKADGGYVVAPPSIHPSGIAYEWIIGLDHRLADLSEVDGLDRHVPAHTPPSPTDPRTRGTRSSSTVDEHVQAALSVLGIGVRLRDGRSAPFRCVLPGHGPDRAASASMWKSPTTGTWVYRDWHGRGDQRALTLADVRASISVGQEVRLRGPERSYWYDRLFMEAGVLELSVETPAVPRRCSAMARRVADGFALVQALRDARECGQPVPYTRKFASRWNGISEDVARSAIDELRRIGVLEHVADLSWGPGGRNTMFGYRLAVVA